MLPAGRGGESCGRRWDRGRGELIGVGADRSGRVDRFDDVVEFRGGVDAGVGVARAQDAAGDGSVATAAGRRSKDFIAGGACTGGPLQRDGIAEIGSGKCVVARRCGLENRGRRRNLRRDAYRGTGRALANRIDRRHLIGIADAVCYSAVDETGSRRSICIRRKRDAIGQAVNVPTGCAAGGVPEQRYFAIARNAP